LDDEKKTANSFKRIEKLYTKSGSSPSGEDVGRRVQ